MGGIELSQHIRETLKKTPDEIAIVIITAAAVTPEDEVEIQRSWCKLLVA